MDIALRALTLSDVPALTALRAAAERADRSGMHFDETDIRSELTDPKLDLATDAVGAWQGAQLVGFATLYAPERVRDVVRFEAAAEVDPARRGHGVGGELIRWMRERARAVHAERGFDAPGELLLSGVATNTGLAALARRTGFTPCRHWAGMTHDLRPGGVPRAAVPAGLRLVPYTAAYEEATRLAHNDAFTDHWDFTGADPEDWRAWGPAGHSFRPELSALLLEPDGRVAAYLLTDEYAADAAATGVRACTLAFLGTRPAHRGRGAARALLAHTLHEARRLGYDRAELVVDTESPTGAPGLYRWAGFRPGVRFVTYAGPLTGC
ncbi:GNAT family N-acetyltransferase [Streptomyces sp. AV19]|uniref:GNAT family N-acetyltransferase n=1 Tax=Streptomyces sp. AV19 TaxID=2793068 RepID=UPI0018FE5977|nr:GNAT family N-acetyltransferase [Streptomyces sp. AV19]MBH1935803.1 GNAT family N-acetyltransferase [Streptomyces sp. AV19]MDG4536105.1 GNAT family N-acetyltransferase [Streptomyces sp. AV19]